MGTYEVVVKLENGNLLTIEIEVVDDTEPEVEKPDYGQDDGCIIHWIILLLLLGYSIYSIIAMLKRRKDIKNLEEALDGSNTDASNIEGGK